MKDNQAKYPQLRFKGFTDPWEERKLEEHAKYRRGSFPQPYGNKEWYDGEGAMPFVQVVDVTNKLTLVENTKQKISKLAQSKSVFVPKGTVVVTLQGSIGRVAITQYDSFVDRTLLIFEDYEKETDERFWAYTIQKKFEIEKLKAPGGTIKTITKEALSSFDVHLPQFKEQAKIGSFFKQLDDTIALHQRKLAKLKELKQGYLQKLFPKNGSKFPQLRFAGFADAWEQRKLGDITKISTGKLDANAMVENGKYDFYTSGIKKYRIDVAAFEGPSITIAGNGATVGYMHLADNKFNAYQRTYVLQEFLVDRSFIFSEIGNKLPKKIKQEARTGNIPYIVMDMLTELKLSIPQNNSEQQKIGSFFKQLDDTIDLHQRKLEKLQELKKGYLQKMFC
ncbi:restriction endonuclease subunit S [Lentilactobacillus parabuchneri]|uniref:restriction endonuclease subunit S n=1 Tax=Lentilactobacillus parabuchneri TaxID=152331 RepID=UPI00070BDAE8|nr:restriction endonuclease subunit S [Lentilactobacillus parabuchneri]